MNDITAKDRIQRDLQGDLLDDNHATRRYFRCWLDGSYNGEESYRFNVERLKLSHDKPSAMLAKLTAALTEDALDLIADWLEEKEAA